MRRILGEVRSPVLIVGAGQGLLVAELRVKCFHCDGVDFSPEMIRYARVRRGLNLIQADASAMPLGDATYETVIYATGVIDFNSDENAIRSILNEGRRVVKPCGKIVVAFYRLSPALENFLTKVGLCSNSVLLYRKSLETYLLYPSADDSLDDEERAHRLVRRYSSDVAVGSIWHDSREGNHSQDAANRAPNGESSGLHPGSTMPGINGFEVLTWIRRQDGIRGLPVVVLTSSSEMSDVNRAYQLGANSFFEKELDFQGTLDLSKLLKNYWLTKVRTPDASRQERKVKGH